ncbi:MAG: YdeI/OmpD-associated family protein [Bacteroidia bacterium]
MEDKPKRVWDKSSKWPEELNALKAIIATTPLVETTKWSGPAYTYNGKNVLGVGGFANFFTIWFFKGVFLKDEANVLINANEGTTKGLRQWRFTSIDEIDKKLILKYINEAIAVEQQGLSITPSKKETIIPELLQQHLDNDSNLKQAFEAFSPYKQREFCEYVTEAKQDKTKQARLDKILPMIQENRGLNDGYRK